MDRKGEKGKEDEIFRSSEAQREYTREGGESYGSNLGSVDFLRKRKSKVGRKKRESVFPFTKDKPEFCSQRAENPDCVGPKRSEALAGRNGNESSRKQSWDSREEGAAKVQTKARKMLVQH